ncbi:MAG: hypothetical protein U0X39_16125 [Bacteroidales bacterium]
MVQEVKWTVKYDKVLTGLITGIFLPLLVGLVVYLFTAGGRSVGEYLGRINSANIVTHAITLCVFPNILLFLLFNRLDMLKAMKGVLAVTIAWAFIVFILKFI